MQKLKKVVCATLCAMAPMVVFAVGGPSGPKTDYPRQGNIGEVRMNPYDIAPLTAIIHDGGYTLRDVSVRIHPKPNGQEIRYRVADGKVLTHGGIPVFGLYPDWVNKVDVSYTRIDSTGKREKFNETYEMYAPHVFFQPSGSPLERVSVYTAEVKKVDPKYKNRLYFINNVGEKSAHSFRAVWNNPAGGALEWNYWPQNTIMDTTGAIRWYMFADPIYDFTNFYGAGVQMGFQQNDDGALTWGSGQKYMKYDIMGREIFSRRLPYRYIDVTHSVDVAENGHMFLRVAASNYKRTDGKNVRTVRDVITEVDENGNVVDEWRLMDIMDPYRDVVLKVLDQGAVCLNIDASLAGKTLSQEELTKLDHSEKFGDIVGTGAGRNWLHANSVDYDSHDDSIIISSRHQSAIFKIGRDKKVKWILSSPEGWRQPWSDKLLTPVDANGKPIPCEGSVCQGDFDWSWTQHTAFKIDEKSKGDILYITAFDNGDGRGMTQPALPSMKYSRAVVYKIDQKKMTVEQVWRYGKERGIAWFSPVTSITQYQADMNSIFVYSATAGASVNLQTGTLSALPNPWIMEFDWGSKEPAVEIQLKNASGNQAFPFSVEKAFSQ